MKKMIVIGVSSSRLSFAALFKLGKEVFSFLACVASDLFFSSLSWGSLSHSPPLSLSSFGAVPFSPLPKVSVGAKGERRKGRKKKEKGEEKKRRKEKSMGWYKRIFPLTKRCFFRRGIAGHKRPDFAKPFGLDFMLRIFVTFPRAQRAQFFSSISGLQVCALRCLCPSSPPPARDSFAEGGGFCGSFLGVTQDAALLSSSCSSVCSCDSLSSTKNPFPPFPPQKDASRRVSRRSAVRESAVQRRSLQFFVAEPTRHRARLRRINVNRCFLVGVARLSRRRRCVSVVPRARPDDGTTLRRQTGRSSHRRQQKFRSGILLSMAAFCLDAL